MSKEHQGGDLSKAERSSKRNLAAIVKRYPTAILAFIFLCAVPLWYVFVSPEFSELPKDFSYSADVISYDNFFDQEIGDYKGEQRSATTFSLKALPGDSTVLEVESLFDVRTLSGVPIFSVRRIYGIDAHAGTHVAGEGDRDREGYLFGPRMRGVAAQVPDKGSFTYWHVNYDEPITMTYKDEEVISGLNVYHYQATFSADQTKELTNLPEVGKTLGIELDGSLSLWIEPTTGYLVKYEDDAIAYYYDLASGQRLQPWNHFRNRVSDSSASRHAVSASVERQKMLLIQTAVPLFFLILALGFAVQGRVRRYLTEFDTSTGVSSSWRRWIIPSAILLLTLGTTAGFSSYVREFVSQARESEFQLEVERIEDAINDRLEIYASALYGGRGFFNAVDEVSRAEWRAYAQSLDLETNYPGIQGLGYATWVAASDVQAHVASIRAQGFPDYSIRPTGERPVYTAIIYLEPFDKRNRQAFGFDMYQEPTRRDGMNRARDTGAASLSGKVTLVQEIDEDVQAGFLIYVPVYKKGAPVLTAEQRRAASLGFVYSPFRMNNFIQGALAYSRGLINVEIFDGSKESDISEERRMYGQQVESQGSLTTIRAIEFGGHSWVVRYTALGNFGTSALQRATPYIVLGLGGLLGVILFFLTLIINTRRVSALALAQNMTEDLRRGRQRLDHIIQGTNLGTWEWNIQTGEVIINERWAEIIGYKQSELEPVSINTWEKFVHPDDMERSKIELEKHFKGETKYYACEVRMKHKDGKWVWIHDHGKVISWTKDGKPMWMYGTHQDITAERETRQQLNERAVELERANKLMVDRELKMIELKKSLGSKGDDA